MQTNGCKTFNHEVKCSKPSYFHPHMLELKLKILLELKRTKYRVLVDTNNSNHNQLNVNIVTFTKAKIQWHKGIELQKNLSVTETE